MRKSMLFVFGVKLFGVRIWGVLFGREYIYAILRVGEFVRVNV